MDELRRIRKERGLSQQRLADLANVDKVTIVHIENGKVSPKVETLEKLAAALEVELADLFPKVQAPLFRELPESATQEERRAKLEEVEHDIQYVLGRAEYWEQELERGRTTQYARASSAENLALLAVDEFSSFYKWLFDGRARDVQIEIDRGADLELLDEFEALIDTLVERISRTQHILFDNAARLAETQAQKDEIAAKLQEATAATAEVAHRSA